MLQNQNAPKIKMLQKSKCSKKLNVPKNKMFRKSNYSKTKMLKKQECSKIFSKNKYALKIKMLHDEMLRCRDAQILKIPYVSYFLFKHQNRPEIIFAGHQQPLSSCFNKLYMEFYKAHMYVRIFQLS